MLLQSLLAFSCIVQVFTEKERVRCRLDGGCKEDGRQRELLEAVPDIEPAHVWREREAATAEGRPLRHAYREVALTGAPGARRPRYLLPRNYQCFAELDDCGHASETLHPGATEHGSSCETGWVDLDDRDSRGKRSRCCSIFTELWPRCPHVSHLQSHPRL